MPLLPVWVDTRYLSDDNELGASCRQGVNILGRDLGTADIELHETDRQLGQKRDAGEGDVDIP